MLPIDPVKSSGLNYVDTGRLVRDSGRITSPRRSLRRAVIASVLIAIVVVGVVVVFLYKRNSELGPAYQAQKAPIFGQNGIAALYSVWYVPNTRVLILLIAAMFPDTHFYAIQTSEVYTTPRNFSSPFLLGNEKTYVSMPANVCPALSDTYPNGYTISVSLFSDSPGSQQDSFDFEYTCVKTLTPETVTLGDPRIIVSSLA